MNGFSFAGSLIVLSWLSLVLHQLGDTGTRLALSPLGIAVPVALLVLTFVLAHMSSKGKTDGPAPADVQQGEADRD